MSYTIMVGNKGVIFKYNSTVSQKMDLKYKIGTSFLQHLTRLD